MRWSRAHTSQYDDYYSINNIKSFVHYWMLWLLNSINVVDSKEWNVFGDLARLFLADTYHKHYSEIFKSDIIQLCVIRKNVHWRSRRLDQCFGIMSDNANNASVNRGMNNEYVTKIFVLAIKLIWACQIRKITLFINYKATSIDGSVTNHIFVYSNL